MASHHRHHRHRSCSGHRGEKIAAQFVVEGELLVISCELLFSATNDFTTAVDVVAIFHGGGGFALSKNVGGDNCVSNSCWKNGRSESPPSVALQKPPPSVCSNVRLCGGTD